VERGFATNELIALEVLKCLEGCNPRFEESLTKLNISVKVALSYSILGTTLVPKNIKKRNTEKTWLPGAK